MFVFNTVKYYIVYHSLHYKINNNYAQYNILSAWLFDILILEYQVVMDVQISKMGCVNYAGFPKSNYNCE